MTVICHYTVCFLYTICNSFLKIFNVKKFELKKLNSKDKKFRDSNLWIQKCVSITQTPYLLSHRDRLEISCMLYMICPRISWKSYSKDSFYYRIIPLAIYYLPMWRTFPRDIVIINMGICLTRSKGWWFNPLVKQIIF